ncbi:MAG: FAD-dependent oxidoreductase [Bacteroidota bacterium]
MGASPSFWEQESWLNGIDIAIIGGGIVGLSSAIHARERFPTARIVILERAPFPDGASNRNAGFACIGSISELLDDLSTQPMHKVMDTLTMRWEGLLRLRELIGDQSLSYEAYGGFEVFLPEDKERYGKCQEALPTFNHEIEKRLGEPEVFQLQDSAGSSKDFARVSKMIYNRLEGQIHTGKMMRAYWAKAIEMGIEFWGGVEVEEIVQLAEGVQINSKYGEWKVSKLILATNGFSQQFLKHIDLQPARNQVLITKPIPSLKWKGTFHYNKGYGYFRNVGNRVLIGGFRHLYKEEESTAEYALHDHLQDHLQSWLKKNILGQTTFEVESRWSGILGVGKGKNPILEKKSDDLVLALRLGGMGVAIGTAVGKQAAALI